ncbi:hypothetical protein CEXT_586381 [Caerostris extrusa]|uniref:Uncharacterized protein n=1 Tax=Caerostris extrusa TaxID=172846 RepID=A0AAV4RAJ9_CAEEX|nr:hypothetical protein CEXT_586381 [Caerostris extrusa]
MIKSNKRRKNKKERKNHRTFKNYLPEFGKESKKKKKFNLYLTTKRTFTRDKIKRNAPNLKLSAIRCRINKIKTGTRKKKKKQEHKRGKKKSKEEGKKVSCHPNSSHLLILSLAPAFPEVPDSSHKSPYPGDFGS